MDTPKVPRDIVCARPWTRMVAAGALMALSLLVGTTGCGAKSEREKYDDLMKQIAQTYDVYFKSHRPGYVVLTYPKSMAQLPKHKQQEAQIILGILKDQGIPHETMSRDQALVEVASKTKAKTYKAYQIPEAKKEELRGRVVMYLNLQMGQEVETVRHPTAVEYDITIKVWNDPMSFSGVVLD